MYFSFFFFFRENTFHVKLLVEGNMCLTGQ